MTAAPHSPLELELMTALGKLLAAWNAMPVRIYTGEMVEAINEACDLGVRLAATPPASAPR